MISISLEFITIFHFFSFALFSCCSLSAESSDRHFWKLRYARASKLSIQNIERKTMRDGNAQIKTARKSHVYDIRKTKIESLTHFSFCISRLSLPCLRTESHNVIEIFMGSARVWESNQNEFEDMVSNFDAFQSRSKFMLNVWSKSRLLRFGWIPRLFFAKKFFKTTRKPTSSKISDQWFFFFNSHWQRLTIQVMRDDFSLDTARTTLMWCPWSLKNFARC